MTARKEGDFYVLNGVKSWVIAAPIADLAIIWAQVKEAEQCLVNMQSVQDIWRHVEEGMAIANIKQLFDVMQT